MNTPVPTRYENLLRASPVTSVSFGAGGLALFAAEQIPERQIGYVGEGWSPHWLVIGEDTAFGDPLFIDTLDDQLPVYTAPHGEGAWNPTLIAERAEDIFAGMQALKAVGQGREHPVGLKQNPVTAADRAAYEVAIKKAIEQPVMSFWLEQIADL